jgi:hypothetical protein
MNTRKVLMLDGPSDRIERRRMAEVIAREYEDYEVDPGDVEHVLFNLTLPPVERLRRSLRRGRHQGFVLKR